MEKNRESGIELFRCVLMCMIIFLHMLIHGVNGEIVSFRNGQSYEISLFESFFAIFCMVSVNCYVMISGYFGIKINKKKLIKTYLPILFYSFFIALFFFITKKINSAELLKSLFPVSKVTYWFATCYIFLCIVSPILDSIIEKYYQEKRFYLLIAFFLVITWIPRVGNGLRSVLGLSSFGFSQIVVSYVIGRCISLLEIDSDSQVFIKTRKIFVQNKIYDFLFFIVCSLVSFSVTAILFFITKKNYWFALSAYSSPMTIFASIFLFQFFKKLKLGHKKIINIFGSTTFGIYLIHENPYMRPVIYQFFHAYDFKFSSLLIPYISLCTLVVFIMGGGMDIIRQFFFSTIENIIKEIKR